MHVMTTPAVCLESNGRYRECTQAPNVKINVDLGTRAWKQYAIVGSRPVIKWSTTLHPKIRFSCNDVPNCYALENNETTWKCSEDILPIRNLNVGSGIVDIEGIEYRVTKYSVKVVWFKFKGKGYMYSSYVPYSNSKQFAASAPFFRSENACNNDFREIRRHTSVMSPQVRMIPWRNGI